MTRFVRPTALFLFLTLTTSGCSTARYIPTGNSYAARPENCAIQVFSTSLPDRPYEEIGLLEGEGSWGRDSLVDVLPEMKKEACRAGGDAIILFSTDKSVDVYDDTSDQVMTAHATVIRWRDAR